VRGEVFAVELSGLAQRRSGLMAQVVVRGSRIRNPGTREK
jgi:hypothetical protein